MKKLPVVICIDVEPDDRQVDKGAPKDWTGFEHSREFFSRLRARLQAATGSAAKFSWFLRMDPQIASTYGSASWSATRYAPLITSLERAGDVFGLHIHAWQWNPASARWEIDFADQQWVDHCVRTGFAAFRKSFGRPCRHFRFGDRWLNNPTLKLIKNLGARFDLTIEPGQNVGLSDEPIIGPYLDYTEVPRRPFHASRADFRVPGSAWFGRGIAMIPLSVGSANWSPQSFVSAAAGPGGAGLYEGSLDRVDCQTITGWAYHRQTPGAPVEVEIYDGDRPLAKVKAMTFRPDLLSAGKGDGAHSFSIPVPLWMKDGNPHVIRARVAGTADELLHSPRQLLCQSSAAKAEYTTLNLSCDSWLMCRILDELLSDEQTSYLAMVVRSDATIQADQFRNLQQTFEHLLSHPRAGQLVFETPAALIKP